MARGLGRLASKSEDARMPIESLIPALESQRDVYSQRQRAAANLLTAMKGVTGALGKASRGLRDYAGQGAGPLSPSLLQAQEAFAGLRLREEAIEPLAPELRREVKTLASVVAALRDALAALRGEAVDVVKLGRAYATLQAMRGLDPALTALLPEIEQEVQQAQRALGDTFGVALRHAFAAQGIEIGGRPPRFEAGRFEIAANFVNRSATISFGKEQVARGVRLSVEAVMAAYQREAKAITQRNEDGDRWIKDLYDAWEAARRKRNAADQRANIVDCYFEMVLSRQARTFRSAPSKRTFVDYSRAQFAYDFFEFADRQRRAYQGQRVFAHSATKSQTDSAERSIWIAEGPGPHDGRYIADVVFARDE